MTWWVAGAVAVVSAVSSIKNSQTQQAQADQAKQTDQDNASQAIANMQAVEAQASAQELAQREQSRQQIGRQVTAMADSGTGSLTSGSNAAVLKQSLYNAEVDALNVRYAGQLKGTQYLQSAYDYQAGAEAAGSQASSIASSMYFGAGASALGSLASSYGRRGSTVTTNNGYSTGSGTL